MTLLEKSKNELPAEEIKFRLRFNYKSFDFTYTDTEMKIASGKEVSFNVKPYEGKSNLEFLQFVYDGQDIFGCTGDQSLYECVLLGKFPFYQNPGHKSKLINEYLFLLGDCKLPFEPVYTKTSPYDLEPNLKTISKQGDILYEYYVNFYPKNKDQLISFLTKYQDIAKNILTYFNYVKNDIDYLRNSIDSRKEK